MASKVDQFLAYRLLKHTEAALLKIRRAAGYNTDPYITLDLNDASEREATSKYVVFLDTESHDVIETLSGPSYRPQLRITVHGIVTAEGKEVPRIGAMALEQDVRTAIAACVQTVRQEIGRGCILLFEDCAHDGGRLAPQKQAGFALAITWTYPQGATW